MILSLVYGLCSSVENPDRKFITVYVLNVCFKVLC